MRHDSNVLKRAALMLAALLIGVSVLMPKARVFAQASLPAVSAVTPDRAANDVDTPVEISGSGFTNDDGAPQVFLGATALKQVTWVSETTLTAQVPWGMKAGTYALEVVNPDGASDVLDSAFVVSEAVGAWNTNAIDGGPVHVVVPIPATPGLVYAYSWTTSAVYRSTDSGAHWATVGHAGGQFFNADPLDPDYLYLNSMQSADGGFTWQDMLAGQPWPGFERGPGYYTQAFPDPAHAGTIFLATANIPSDNSEPSGLLRSEDYGQTWETVETGLLPGDTSVTALDFSGGTIYLGTRDGNLYQSADGGDHWQRMGSESALPSIGVLEVNPYEPEELWISTHFSVTAVAQMATVDLSDPLYPVSLMPAWPQSNYPKTLGFLSADSAFIGTNWDAGWITENDGAEWNLFHPSTGKPGYHLSVDPWDTSQNTFYIADEQYGVQKTTDRGVTWSPANTGLHAMSPDYLAVAPNNPSLVYAKIAENGWPGIFVSDNGGQSWDFSSLEPAASGLRPVTSMLAVSGDRVFAGAHGNEVLGYGPQLFISEDQGSSWRRVSADPVPEYSDSFHMPWTMKADPQQPETLLLTAVIGNRLMTTDQYVSEIYRSTDHGDTWQRVGLADQIGHQVNNLMQLAFDPNDPDVVYAAGEHVILKSSDNGLTWSALIDDEEYWLAAPIAVEPVSPYRVYVGNMVSTDGGASWDWKDLPIGVSQMQFVPGSDTLYIAGDGLAVSDDGGDTWQIPEGALASTRINGLAVSRSDQRTVVYVGTPGGETPVEPPQSPRAAVTAQADSPAALEAGVYRMTAVRYDVFLPFVTQQ